MKKHYTLSFEDYFINESKHYISILESLKSAREKYLNKGLISEEEFQLIKSKDPDQVKFKFTEIMCKWWIESDKDSMPKNEFTLNRYQHILKIFINQQQNLGKDKKGDINQYTTYSSLSDELSTRSLFKGKSEIERIKLIDDIEIIYESDGIIAVQPKTHKASFEYGNKCTNWCTTSKTPAYWNHYIESGVEFYYIYDSTVNSDSSYIAFAKYPNLETLQKKLETKIFQPFEIFNKKDASLTPNYFNIVKYFKDKTENSEKFINWMTDGITEDEFNKKNDEYLNFSKIIIEDWLDDNYYGFLGKKSNDNYFIDYYFVYEDTYYNENDELNYSLNLIQLLHYLENNLPLDIDGKLCKTVNECIEIIFNGDNTNPRNKRPIFSYGLIDGGNSFSEILEYCLVNNLINSHYFNHTFSYNKENKVVYEETSIPALLAMNRFTEFNIDVAIKLLQKCDKNLFNKKYTVYEGGLEFEYTPYEILMKFNTKYGKKITPKLKKIYLDNTDDKILDFTEELIIETPEKYINYIENNYIDKTENENCLFILDVLKSKPELISKYKNLLLNFVEIRIKKSSKETINSDILLSIINIPDLFKNVEGLLTYLGYYDYLIPIYDALDKNGYTFSREVVNFTTNAKFGEHVSIMFILNNCENFVKSLLEYWTSPLKIDDILDFYKYQIGTSTPQKQMLKQRIKELFKNFV